MQIGIDCRAFQCQSRYLGIGTYTANLFQALTTIAGKHRLIPFASMVRRGGENGETPFASFVDHQGFRITGRRSLLHQLAAHHINLCHLFEFTPPFSPPDQTVITVYDLIPFLFPKRYFPWYRMRSRWQYRTYTRFLQEVRQIIAVSRQTRADLIHHLGIPEDRITVIYPGVSPAFRPLAGSQEWQPVLERHGIRTPFLLHVGSCDYRKNLSGLFQAFAQFQASGGQEVQLVLVGKATELRRTWLLQQATQRGVGRSVRLLGYLPEEELVALYNAALILVYPSLYEGFGFPPLEAMACGTPVVASTAPALREVIEGCAVLVDPQDPQALAEAMRRLAQDRGLREGLIRQGLARAQQFTWLRTAQAVLALYEHLGT